MCQLQSELLNLEVEEMLIIAIHPVKNLKIKVKLCYKYKCFIFMLPECILKHPCALSYSDHILVNQHT